MARMDDSTLRRLTDELASADPAVRDDGAFSALATALSEQQVAPAQRHWLGEQMVERLSHPDPQARSFAPLIFAVLAETWSVEDDAWPDHWSDALLSWWPAEQDLRGYVAPVGWIHAVAHGADAVGTLGAVRLVPSRRLLATIAERLTATTEFVWRDQEDDRVAAAVCGILLGDPDADLAALLEPVSAMFAAGEHGPVPAAATNTMHTLRSLYVALGNAVIHPETREPHRIPNAAALQRSIAETLQATTPWLFTTGG